METEGMSKAQELENLRLRLSAEEDRHNDSRKEVTRLKSRVGSTNVDMDLFYGMNKLFYVSCYPLILPFSLFLTL